MGNGTALGAFFIGLGYSKGVLNSGVFGTYPLAAGVATALPKRAASALSADDEEPDQGHQARPKARPRPEEVQEVERPHIRDAGPVQPDVEEAEPQADADEDTGQGGGKAGPFLSGLVMDASPWRILSVRARSLLRRRPPYQCRPP